ncbi:MAG: hypothetical protein Q9214_004759 [Letrouitia sp. 1 TL-2023]
MDVPLIISASGGNTDNDPLGEPGGTGNTLQQLEALIPCNIQNHQRSISHQKKTKTANHRSGLKGLGVMNIFRPALNLQVCKIKHII